MLPDGLEHPTDSPKNLASDKQSGAESDAPGALSSQIDAGLAAVIEAWPTLPVAIRAGIVAMVQAAGAGPT